MLFRYFRALSFLAVFIALWAPFPVRAQTSQSNQEKQEQKDRQRKPGEDVIAIDTAEVLLPVTVRDSSGQFVTDLRAEDFIIYEDGAQQPISSFALKRMPVHVVMMIDTSSSVAHELEDFKEAAWRFINQLDPEDKFSLIRFDDQVELVQDWTQQPQRAETRAQPSGNRDVHEIQRRALSGGARAIGQDQRPQGDHRSDRRH